MTLSLRYFTDLNAFKETIAAQLCHRESLNAFKETIAAQLCHRESLNAFKTLVKYFKYDL